MAARARQAELNLVEPIERSDDNDGNIGKVAKTALKRKGSPLLVEGKIQTRSWDERESGQKKYRTEILIYDQRGARLRSL